jgi:hypothetical protein
LKLTERVDLPRRKIHWKQAGLILACTVVIVALWGTWVVYPLKILVVFFHELSHGLAALATGGRIVEVQVDAGEGGMCLTDGGSRFISLSAGYLGSLIFGGALLLGASHMKHKNIPNLVLGLVIFVATLLWVRPWHSFGFFFGLGAGIAFVAAAQKLSKDVNGYILTVIGLTSALYAVLDIKGDILDRPEARSDAVMLAEHTGVPAIMWGAGWMIVSICLAFVFLVFASSHLDDGDKTSSHRSL